MIIKFDHYVKSETRGISIIHSEITEQDILELAERKLLEGYDLRGAKIETVIDKTTI